MQGWPISSGMFVIKLIKELVKKINKEGSVYMVVNVREVLKDKHHCDTYVACMMVYTL